MPCPMSTLHVSRDTEQYLVVTGGEGAASLVYDPSVDLWSPLTIVSTITSEDGDPQQLWSPCRATVHKAFIYLLGNRDSTLANDFYLVDMNHLAGGLVEQQPFREARVAPSVSSCDCYLYLVSGQSVERFRCRHQSCRSCSHE